MLNPLSDPSSLVVGSVPKVYKRGREESARGATRQGSAQQTWRGT